MIRRSPLPPRTKPVRKTNPKRRQSEFARCYGSKARVLFVKSLPCFASSTFCEGPIENAHTEGGGCGRKADANTVIPLCRFHHQQLHWCGVDTFAASHGTRLFKIADETERLWQEYSERTTA